MFVQPDALVHDRWCVRMHISRMGYPAAIRDGGTIPTMYQYCNISCYVIASISLANLIARVPNSNIM